MTTITGQQLPNGRRLAHYRILEKIGEGGMGQVYAAEDTRLDRRVALKVLSTAAPDAAQLARFEREAKMAASLDHPNILAIHDYGAAEGIAYVVMELLRGRTLRDVLEAGPVPAASALRYGVEISQALTAAHGSGVCHRDLKPENVFITDDDRVKILDFGLAFVRRPEGIDPASVPTTMGTLPGIVMGTPGYLAPEQVQGASDHRSDLFALGVVLFELLSGRRAFTGPTVIDSLHATLRVDPPFDLMTDAGVLPDVIQIVRQCVAKRPEDRYQSAVEVGRALQAALDDPALRADSRPARTTEAAARGHAIAVLPFRNLSADDQMEYFSDGVTEDIINALGHLRSLHVAARTSCFAFKGKQTDLAEVGARLRVDTVLEGSVRRVGQKLRITAQLVKVADGFQLWSERYDRDLDDVFAIQDDIAENIVRSLQLTLGGGLDQARPGTDSLEAYDLYLKGRFHVEQRGEGIARGLKLLQQSIAADPRYAPAYAALAETLTLLAVYGVGRPAESMPHAKAAALRAVELDGGLADAHAAIAMIRLLHDRDWDGAAIEFDRALELNPSHGPARYWKGLLYWLFVRGNLDMAMSETMSAAALDPMAVLPIYALGVTLICAGRFQEAVERCLGGLALDPTSAVMYRLIGVAHVCDGRYEEGVAALEKGVVLSSRHPWLVSDLGWAYANAGREKEAEQLHSELLASVRSSLPLVAIPLALGRLDDAADHLVRAHEEREPMLIALARWPPMRPVLAHPKVRAIVEQLGIEP